MDQGDLFRDKGMKLASDAQEWSSPGWNARAYFAIVKVAHTQPTVHVDDVQRTFTEQPQHPNAWGPVWRKCVRDGVIATTGVTKEASDPKKHKRWCRVYKSLLY